MRTLLLACGFVIAGPAVAADPPPKMTEPPYAALEFRDSPKEWDMTLEMRTESGSVYELPIDLSYGNAFRFMTQVQLIRANWMAEMYGERSIAIYGVRTRQGKADAIKSLVMTTRVRKGMGRTPRLACEGEVKVEEREDDGKEKPARAGKRPRGPDLGAEPFVEFDFKPLPPAPGIKGEYTLRVETETRIFQSPAGGDVHYHDSLASVWESCLSETGFKCEVVGKSKLRVYGHSNGDRFYPAIKGKVKSDDLAKDQLPRVTQPQIKG